MSFYRRTTIFVLGFIACLALLVWNLGQIPTATTAGQAPKPRALVNEPLEDSGRLRELNRRVKHYNQIAAKERERFRNDGWDRVETTPPDEKIVSLDESALSARRAELETQLQTNTPVGEELAAAARIALAATEERTSRLALEAIGRSRDEQAIPTLMRVFNEARVKAGGETLQEEAIGLIQPASLADAASLFLAEILRDAGVAEKVKARAAAQLASTELAADQLPGALTQALPAAWKEKIEELRRRLKVI